MIESEHKNDETQTKNENKYQPREPFTARIFFYIRQWANWRECI